MNTNQFTRRQTLRAAALVGAANFVGFKSLQAFPVKAKMASLSEQEIAAIESAMGKKGTYNQEQVVHTTPLPRNDLKVTIKGDAVPIPFGFGGWASIKKQYMVSRLCS